MRNVVEGYSVKNFCSVIFKYLEIKVVNIIYVYVN